MDALWFSFVLALLATWRVTHLIAREDGPGDVLVKLRVRAGTGVLGRLMDCFNCLSLWVAAPFAVAVGRDVLETVLSWLALSGGACLLERTDRERVTIRELADSKGDIDGMLWRQTSGGAESGGSRIGAGSGDSHDSSTGTAAGADYLRPGENRPRADS